MLKRARQQFDHEALSRWFADKYKLPANHPLYLARSDAEHMVEQYADLYAQREDAQMMLTEVQKARSADVDAQKAQNAQKRALIEQLNGLNRILEEPLYDDDPLLTQWDRELEAGRTPDFKRRR